MKLAGRRAPANRPSRADSFYRTPVGAVFAPRGGDRVRVLLKLLNDRYVPIELDEGQIGRT